MKLRLKHFFVLWGLLIATIWVGHELVRDFIFVDAEPRAIEPRGTLADFETQNIEVCERIAPLVAYIFTHSDSGRPDTGPVRGGAGSGFIWDRAGHIVTNHHVVAGASDVAVRLDSGSAVRAIVVGNAPDYDLAVLRLERSPAGLQPIPIGTSSDLKVGQAVFAIGNPFGLSRTLTTGIVSALDRSLPTETGREVSGVIQTDAAINPGNSGGPLIDTAGRLIGVNTAIISGSGSSSGIGFAVPVDVVNKIVPEVIARGKASRPGIGISVAPQGFTARLGIDGVAVYEVLPDRSASQAGLRGFDRERGLVGDIITHVDGVVVSSLAELATALDRVGVGNTAALTVLRGSQRLYIDVNVIDIS